MLERWRYCGKVEVEVEGGRREGRREEKLNLLPPCSPQTLLLGFRLLCSLLRGGW